MKDEIISICIPTRKRQLSMIECATSAIKLAHDPKNIEIIFYLDDDDEESINAIHIIHKFHSQTKFVMGKRIILSDMWNKCTEIATGNIFMQCGDDIRFRTRDWDKMVRDAFNQVPDKIAFVFGYDGIHPMGKFGTHGFLHRQWMDVVGYFLPPYFEADYCDTWINEVAKSIDRYIFIDVFTEHLHYTIGKHDLDITHVERLNRAAENKVLEKYISMKPQRMDDAMKLYKYIVESARK